jgi:hypothetical protein
MDYRKTAPPLDLNFSTLNGKVKGHKSRCQALDELWRTKYFIDYSLDEIHVVDFPIEKNNGVYKKTEISFDGEFVVEITDVDALSSTHANIIVNYNIGATSSIVALSRLDKNARLLLGERYFIADYRISTTPGYNDLAVVIAPGGNQDIFLENINLNHVAKLFGKTITATGMDKGELLMAMASSRVVITTPSTTAMEALALGIPVLLIRTSWDQTGEFVKNGYAEWFSEKEVEKYTQKKMKAKKGIPTDNVVVDEIYNEWTKWRFG